MSSSFNCESGMSAERMETVVTATNAAAMSSGIDGWELRDMEDVDLANAPLIICEPLKLPPHVGSDLQVFDPASGRIKIRRYCLSRSGMGKKHVHDVLFDNMALPSRLEHGLLREGESWLKALRTRIYIFIEPIIATIVIPLAKNEGIVRSTDRKEDVLEWAHLGESWREDGTYENFCKIFRACIAPFDEPDWFERKEKEFMNQPGTLIMYKDNDHGDNRHKYVGSIASIMRFHWRKMLMRINAKVGSKHNNKIGLTRNNEAILNMNGTKKYWRRPNKTPMPCFMIRNKEWVDNKEKRELAKEEKNRKAREKRRLAKQNKQRTQIYNEQSQENEEVHVRTAEVTVQNSRVLQASKRRVTAASTGPTGSRTSSHLLENVRTSIAGARRAPQPKASTTSMVSAPRATEVETTQVATARTSCAPNNTSVPTTDAAATTKTTGRSSTRAAPEAECTIAASSTTEIVAGTTPCAPHRITPACTGGNKNTQEKTMVQTTEDAPAMDVQNAVTPIFNIGNNNEAVSGPPTQNGQHGALTLQIRTATTDANQGNLDRSTSTTSYLSAPVAIDTRKERNQDELDMNLNKAMSNELHSMQRKHNHTKLMTNIMTNKLKLTVKTGKIHLEPDGTPRVPTSNGLFYNKKGRQISEREANKIFRKKGEYYDENGFEQGLIDDYVEVREVRKSATNVQKQIHVRWYCYGLRWEVADPDYMIEYEELHSEGKIWVDDSEDPPQPQCKETGITKSTVADPAPTRKRGRKRKNE